jgi:hypothetical protein
VIDSPLYPGESMGSSPAKCTWTIYKSLEAIPEEAYRRIGKAKPLPVVEWAPVVPVPTWKEGGVP